MQKYQLAKSIAWNSFEDQVFVISFNEKKQLHELNPAASFLWTQLQNNLTAEELVSRLCAHYDVDEQEAKKDVDLYLAELRSKGLLEVEP